MGYKMTYAVIPNTFVNISMHFGWWQCMEIDVIWTASQQLCKFSTLRCFVFNKYLFIYSSIYLFILFFIIFVRGCCCFSFLLISLNRLQLLFMHWAWLIVEDVPSNLSYKWNVCINYIFILELTSGFSRLGKNNCTTRRETFTFWDFWCTLY